jgi:hypothetical protein
MLHSLSGLVLISKDCEVQINKWKDGAFLNFAIVSQEATNGDKAKLHKYRASLYVRASEIKLWMDKLKPGNMFLLTNGNLSAEIREGFDYSIPQIKISAGNFNILKRPVKKEGIDEEEREGLD